MEELLRQASILNHSCCLSLKFVLKKQVPSMKDIRTAIEKFMQDYWLTEVVNEMNQVTLHGRALLELSQYIKQVFDPEILQNCHLCKSLVLIYFDCENCSIRMHRHCAKKFFKEVKDSCKCPKCHKPISAEHLTGMIEGLASAKMTLTQLTQRTQNLD